MFSQSLNKILQKENLTETDAKLVMDTIMEGKLSNSQIAALLIGLRMKGETVEEIAGFATSMKENAQKFDIGSYAIDTCGTGGDGGKTFNISTAVSIVTAAGGVSVVKHGNKAVSSKSGSADVLLQLGFNIDMEPNIAKNCLEKNGMTFLFAPKYHLAMKNVAPIRGELGIRTIFNLLGPLSNPADIKGQVVGIYDGNLTNIIANVLLKLGRERALVVHGNDGLDEITTTTTTKISEVINGEVIDYTLSPEQFNMRLSTIEELSGGDAKENAEIILDIFKGEKGAKRDIVVLNSGAALYVGKVASSLEEGVILAEKIIDSGKAYRKLNELVDYNRRCN
ncbi:anthranilate phosphoribosyltransferase TrpD [Gottschalkia purinilytica]|uniref:Anthranilate phosphoribosyltransferase n=1 Tax=Gottschalkia purinilytica TaxID=1503 RepID=A0A0L0W9L4_GOTPU|nr:anthranilate phosphoribosyltransferase [Gottschalkia purinilytica]KNF08137.1 anthranilate phosphoribosyltransferase TrpD [Gottschalkia purinilytica]